MFLPAMKQCVPDVCFSLIFLLKSTANMSQTRRETDSFGPMEVPAQYYYGAVTARSLVNFNIGGERERMPVSSSRIILRRSQCAVVHYSACVLDLSFCPCVRLSLFWYVLECSSLLFGHSAFSSKLQRRSTRWWGGLKVAWQRRSFRLARRCVVAANFCCMACCFHFESHGHPRVVPLHQLETVWDVGTDLVCSTEFTIPYRIVGRKYLQPMHGVRGFPLAGVMGAASPCSWGWANRLRSIPTDSLSIGPVLATSLPYFPDVSCTFLHEDLRVKTGVHLMFEMRLTFETFLRTRCIHVMSWSGISLSNGKEFLKRNDWGQGQGMRPIVECNL